MAISNKEAKQLLYAETPVYFEGSKYKKINGLIYRKRKDRYKISAELLDMNHNSVVICPIEWIDPTDEEKIEIVGQEEAEEVLSTSKNEMANLINFVSQNKPREAKESLHSLFINLMKLDDILIKQYRLGTSLGGLEKGKEEIIPQREEEIWEAN